MTHFPRGLPAVRHAIGASLLGAALLSASAASAQPVARPTTPIDMHGAWRMHDGGIVALYRTASGDSGWRFVDFRNGASHRLYPRDALTFTSSDAWTGATPAIHRYALSLDANGRAAGLTLTRAGARARHGRRVAIREDSASFTSGGTTLVGKLISPATGRGPWPVVVYVHGSDSVPSIDRVWEPYLLAAHGVAMFVFDKRGTGGSGGRYTQLFTTLADDVVAATAWLRRQPHIDSTRIGLAGFSQGGWVAPLAASKDPGIRFMLVSYGMTMSVAEEDQLEAPLKLRAQGFTDTDVREFQELNGAIHRAAGRRFAEGWGEVEAAAARYRDRRWLTSLPGTQSWAGMILGMGIEQAKVVLPQMLLTYIDPFYNSVPTLESLDIPILWLIAGDDIEAPPAPTIAALAALRAKGKRIETRIFPRTDHGITEFSVKGTQRTTTRYAPAYAQTMADWISRQVRR
jgi:dienelactone hydrolase